MGTARHIATALLAVALCCAAAASADDADERDGSRWDFRNDRVRKTGMRFRKDIEKMVEALNLPEEQKEQLLRDLRKQKAEQERLEKKHAERTAKLKAEMEKLRKEQRERMGKLETVEGERMKGAVDPRSMLTAEQLREWETHRLFRRVCHDYRGARLTKDQREKLRDACESEARKLAEPGLKNRAELERKARGRLDSKVGDLLTRGQKHTLLANTVERGTLRAMRGLHLDHGQYLKIARLCDQAVKDLNLDRAADAREPAEDWTKLYARRGTLTAELIEKVREDVLTREQRAKLAEVAEKDAARGSEKDAPKSDAAETSDAK